VRRPRCCAYALGTVSARRVFGISECVWHVIPVGFLVFMLSMGVVLLRRRWRVKGLTGVSRRGRDVLGLRPVLGPRLSGLSPLVVVERDQSHVLTCGRGEITSPSLAAWQMAPPERFIGARLPPV
jgi:hypothetical protein